MQKKAEVQSKIKDIYHAYKDMDGYQSMKVYLAHRGYHYSSTTIHKYMHTEMRRFSVVHPKKTKYEHYTSKAFSEFCESVNVIQSMRKATYPYDNAAMERYFNTLKDDRRSALSESRGICLCKLQSCTPSQFQWLLHTVRGAEYSVSNL